jgi:hypothetical protein
MRRSGDSSRDARLQALRQSNERIEAGYTQGMRDTRLFHGAVRGLSSTS